MKISTPYAFLLKRRSLKMDITKLLCLGKQILIAGKQQDCHTMPVGAPEETPVRG